jgi:hypothetical protein
MAAQAVAADQLTTAVVWDVQEEQEILLLQVPHKEILAVVVLEQLHQVEVAEALLTLVLMQQVVHQELKMVVQVAKQLQQKLLQVE